MNADLRSFARALSPRLTRSGSSFRLLIILLPPTLRHALTILYLYCRAVDDCADDGSGEGLARLSDWQAALTSGHHPDDPLLAQATLALRQHYDLPPNALAEVIEGCRQDLTAPLHRPSRADLDRYCDRVAGAVGILILCLSGIRPPELTDFARTAGRALQYTNILRDLAEDADRGRCYLPDGTTPDALAAEATHLFQICLRQRAALPPAQRRKLAAATGFILVYQSILTKLLERGFTPAVWRTPIRPCRWRLARAASRTILDSWR